MTDSKKKLRLDEILLVQGLIDQDQIKQALARQKEHGGRFGSQLLNLGFIDEAQLVQALAEQMDSDGVVLSGMEIPPIVAGLIPKRVSMARKVIAFDYDLEDNLIKIACDDPTDADLQNELSFIARGKDIQLFVAAEHALSAALEKHFPAIDDDVTEEMEESGADAVETPASITFDEIDEPDRPDPAVQKTVLLVTDEPEEVEHFRVLLEQDFFGVEVTDSADDAIGMLDNQRFHTVFIRDTVAGDYIDLIDRLRKISPRTGVRYYESAASLLLDCDSQAGEGDLLVRNLNLFTSLLSTRERLDINHSGLVGRYVEKLCSKLGLPAKDRLAVINAGYVHDLARFYHKVDDTNDYRLMIGETVALLESINYPPVVIEMLRSMYKDLKGRFTRRLPIEALGGNILTIVDLFCENMPPSQRISLDKFDTFQMKIRELTGKLFLSEVAEAFIGMVKQEMLKTETDGPAVQVMLFAEDPAKVYSLELRMRHEGYRTISATTIDAFTGLYQRSTPDIIVLMPRGDAVHNIKLIDQLAVAGIKFAATPAFLIMDGAESARLSVFFEKGIEDVLAADGAFDLLLVKMQKIRQSIANDEESAEVPEASEELLSSTRGLLSDMNLVDLLQAMGPSQKTVKITITDHNEPSRELVMYLLMGQIVNAQLGDISGPEAVYESVSWINGSWSISPIAAADLPEPNNDQTNESILMEGCRLLDEKTRV